MNIFAAPWRPAQVRLAPAMGQQTISNVPAPAPRPALIDSPLMAVLLDATVGGGALMIGTGYMKKAKANPNNKERLKTLGYLFFGVTGLAGIKLLLDGARLGQ